MNTEEELITETISESTSKPISKGLLAGFVGGGMEILKDHMYIAIPILSIGGLFTLTCIIKRRRKKRHARVMSLQNRWVWTKQY